MYFIPVFCVMRLNTFFSEKGFVGFTRLSKGSMTQKGLQNLPVDYLRIQDVREITVIRFEDVS
jgi:hypothetical protein